MASTEITFILTVGTYKIVALILGFLIVRLGHDTLVRGIKGDFKFSADASDSFGAKLTSGSPGLLFVLLGTLLMGYALFVEKPMQSIQPGSANYRLLNQGADDKSSPGDQTKSFSEPD